MAAITKTKVKKIMMISNRKALIWAIKKPRIKTMAEYGHKKTSAMAGLVFNSRVAS
ncbi:hypothetical protein JKG47_10070 [Acidithiobacillus sp. MC6.1]|nr:hypothetical protein [Acidithiobacillus sp. MC6.1]